tara:strand:+ start:215 stop:529 length:315 start_codon:yes stop_codon:yes gene_type:complete
MKEYNYIWITSEGKKIHVDDMTESHAKNCLKLLLRKIEDYNTEIIKDRIIEEKKAKAKRYESGIADRILEEGRIEEENEEFLPGEYYRDKTYKYNHETGLFDIN